MEPHSLRFVRCPKCHQLLVEYPSIPVYKCGGCGTVLRVKHRAVPKARAGSESGEHGSPCSLKGSPSQSRGLICSGEQRADPSVDRPHEATAQGSVPSTASNIDSFDGAVPERTMSAADSGVITHAKHLNKDTPSLTDDGNTQNTGVMVKERETHDEDAGAGSSSDLTERVENDDTGEKANGGKIGTGTSELSTTLYEKSQAAHREERPHTYEGVNVEYHKALIEELERSLSFSSDDEYLSYEAESSGLSDALRNQMGSRRFRVNDAPRCDPHGRLIEELEMSFSDAEEPLEQHGMSADRVHGNVLNKDPQALGAKSAHPCEESLSSFDIGHLKSEQTSCGESRATGNDNKENDHIEDNNNTTDSVHGSEHIMIVDDKIADRFHEKEHVKDCQPANTESAYPFEGSTSSVDDVSIEVKQSSQLNDLTVDVNREMEDGKIASDYLVPADSHEKEHGNDNVVLVPIDEDISETVCVNEEVTANGTQEMEDGYMEDDKMTNCVHDNDSMLADENIAERVHTNEDLTADGTQEMEEVCMEDGNMTNYVHVSDNLLFVDEDTAERVHGIEDTADDAGENEESCMENENENENVNVAVADEDIAKKVHENEHGKDRQSLEDRSAHLYEGVITSFSAGYAKSEHSFQQDEPIPDAPEEKEEDFMEDGNTANCIQENRAAVARFSSLPNKRNQSKLASFNKNKEQMTYRSRGNQLRQGRSLDSEDFHSIQNFMESQMDGTSSSLSSGSPSRGDLVHRAADKLNNNIRHERLKKMDELRDQLSRLSSQKGLERSFQKRGLDYQQQSNSYDVEHHLQSVDGDSAPSSCALESYYGHVRPPRYPPPNHFSPTHTYTHCHFGHAQTHNYEPWEFNSYYQSSYAESTILDHESLRSSYKEQKRVVRKHILRPLSGASPFTICNSCFNLVQMPSDIYISKAKVGKVQCGKCSKVLALSFPAVYNSNAKSTVDVAHESYNLDDSTVAKNDDIASYYAECLTGGPVSISEDYGASYTRSLPTQAGSSSLAATKGGKKVSDSALHRLMGYDSASQLLRHSRVFEDGYESFESMVPVSSRVSRRKNK